MARRSPVNVAASIRQRLQNRAREHGEDFQRAALDLVMQVTKDPARGTRPPGGPWTER